MHRIRSVISYVYSGVDKEGELVGVSIYSIFIFQGRHDGWAGLLLWVIRSRTEYHSNRHAGAYFESLWNASLELAA